MGLSLEALAAASPKLKMFTGMDYMDSYFTIEFKHDYGTASLLFGRQEWTPGDSAKVAPSMLSTRRRRRKQL
jgi:hypothetical protein